MRERYAMEWIMRVIGFVMVDFAHRAGILAIQVASTALVTYSLFFASAYADEPLPRSESTEGPWALTGFYGVFTDDNTFSDTLTGVADLNSDFKLAGLSLSRSFWRPIRHLQFEGEVQVVKHVAGQHHWELNGLGVARWVTFPWQQYLRTSFAFGAGLSYASEDPEFEVTDAG
jgi:hypothetical protein